jgi:hypothetical protein
MEGTELDDIGDSAKHAFKESRVTIYKLCTRARDSNSLQDMKPIYISLCLTKRSL